MAQNLKYAVALKNQKLDQITSKVGNAGLLRLYDGAQPASPDAAVTTQNKIAELTCGTPFGAASAGGVLTAGAVSSAAALMAGTPTWFRLCTSAGVAIVDGTVGMSGTFDLVLDNTNIASGQNVAVSSLTITSAN